MAHHHYSSSAHQFFPEKVFRLSAKDLKLHEYSPHCALKYSANFIHMKTVAAGPRSTSSLSAVVCPWSMLQLNPISPHRLLLSVIFLQCGAPPPLCQKETTGNGGQV